MDYLNKDNFDQSIKGEIKVRTWIFIKNLDVEETTILTPIDF